MRNESEGSADPTGSITAAHAGSPDAARVSARTGAGGAGNGSDTGSVVRVADTAEVHAPTDGQPRACGAGSPAPTLDRSRILRHSGAGWDAVRPLPYKSDDGTFSGITRRILASPEAAAFDVRYFEIVPDGHSSLERHAHTHVVICFRGRGRVRLGEELHEVGYGDVVYVAPREPHQFLNPYTEPFGFLCIVDRDRDRPEPTGG